MLSLFSAKAYPRNDLTEMAGRQRPGIVWSLSVTFDYSSYTDCSRIGLRLEIWILSFRTIRFLYPDKWLGQYAGLQIKITPFRKNQLTYIFSDTSTVKSLICTRSPSACCTQENEPSIVKLRRNVSSAPLVLSVSLAIPGPRVEISTTIEYPCYY